ncbi:MAG TPA: ATPase, T2SS/T4P/T4SS family [Vicinamibacteria bacterium]|nr:ATPase, T2SS/T4P/T4SS family [Vicinamibacteria bacterium]
MPRAQSFQLSSMATNPRRPPAPTTESSSVPNLLSILKEEGMLSPQEEEQAIRFMRVQDLNEEAAIRRLGTLSEDDIAQAVARHAGLPYLKINPLDLDLDVVTSALPAPFARKHTMCAVSKHGNTVTLAIANPFNRAPLRDLQQFGGLEVKLVVASRRDIELVNKGFYDLKSSLKAAESQLTEGRLSSIDVTNQEFLSGPAVEMDPTMQPVVTALDNMLSHAFDQRASDIHMEPKRNIALVRLRIDGVLHDVHVIPKIVYQAVVSRVKMLSGLNIAEKRRPQDGRIKRTEAGKEIEIRVSTMPTVFGEKAVLRIFDPEILLKSVEELGFSATELPRFTSFLEHREGIILVTGPTGSGKTTTLYSVLKHLSRPEVNIITIEDPVELVYDDFNQIQIKPEINVTFASSIKTVLRQDPDIIMVGEIRDAETAEMAIQAALTGHLVLSTLHTNDAPSAVTRLLDLGVPPFLITSTLIGVLAQRLVRSICPKCVEDCRPTEDDAMSLNAPFEKIKNLTFRRGRGCIHCRQTGYHGRVGIFEIMAVSRKIRKLVASQAAAPEIVRTAREEGMKALRESAIQKLVRGETTVAEVIRVTSQ